MFSAYLNMKFREPPVSIRNAQPILVDVRIYSEQTPTGRAGEFYACLLEIRGSSFAEAKAAIERQCAEWPHLRWALPYLARQ